MILPFILITLIFEPITITNSQNTQPIFTAQSVSAQQESGKQFQNPSLLTNISGNIFYFLAINTTFVFPQDAPFTGVLNIGCGIGVSLVNTTAWQVINLLYWCPNYMDSIPAGTYNSALFINLNSMKNYTDSNYPKNIEFYIHSTMTKPEYKSVNYSINLANNVTIFSQNISHISASRTLPVSLILASFGIFALVEYRKHKRYKRRKK